MNDIESKPLNIRLREMYIEAKSKNPGGIEGFDTPLIFEVIAALEQAHLSTSNGLTDGEIEEVAEQKAELWGDHANKPLIRTVWRDTLRYARDRGMLPSSNVPVVTVDAIMEVHRKWLDDVDCYDDWIVDAFSDLRSRLTTLFPPPRH